MQVAESEKKCSPMVTVLVPTTHVMLTMQEISYKTAFQHSNSCVQITLLPPPLSQLMCVQHCPSMVGQLPTLMAAGLRVQWQTTVVMMTWSLMGMPCEHVGPVECGMGVIPRVVSLITSYHSNFFLIACLFEPAGTRINNTVLAQLVSAFL